MKSKPDSEHGRNDIAERQPVPRWLAKVFLAAIVLAVLVVELRAAALRSLWFDELSTLIVSSAPTMRQMFREIPVDGNPPLYFLLARFCLHLPIRTELALRLPSIAAINVAALMIYLFVRRNARSIFAFFAMSIFLGSAMGSFAAMEARPYALLLCFTSVAICCWQSAARQRKRRLALAGIAAAMAGAIFSHHYGVIYVTLPLLAGEGVRAWQNRRIDLPVVGAMLAGAATLLITFPPMLHEQAGLLRLVKQCSVFWARPQLGSFSVYWSVYSDTVPKPAAALALIVGALAAFPYAILARNGVFGKPAKPPSRPPIEDLAVGSALALLLPVMLVVTRIGTGYFWDRYAAGTALGIAVLSGLLLSWLSERLPAIEAFVFAGILYSLSSAMIVFWFVSPVQRFAGAQADPLFLSAPAQETIVIANAVRFAPAWWYADPAARGRLHYLSDLDYAVKQLDFIPEYTLTAEQQFGAPKLDSYKEFLAAHREFLLYCDGTSRLEWVKNRLGGDGWQLVPIGSQGTRELFRVFAPASVPR